MHNTALLLCNYHIIADKCTSAMDCLYENFNKLFKEYEHEYNRALDFKKKLNFAPEFYIKRLN